MIEFFDDEGVIGTIEYDEGDLVADILLQSVAQSWIAGGRDPADFEDAYDGWSNGYASARLIELDDESETLISDALPFHLPGRHSQKSHGNRVGRKSNVPSMSSKLAPINERGNKSTQSHRKAPHGASVPLTDENIAALETYVGLTGFYLINSSLRGTDDAIAYAKAHPQDMKAVERDIERIRDAMRPLTNDTTVYRGVKLSQFPGLTNLDELPSLVGKTVHDKAFISTSKELSGKFLGSGAAVNDHILMKINVPARYPVADLENMFDKKWGEKEMLLDSGTTFSINDAEIVELAPGVFRWQVTMDVAS